ncbi:MAG: hypothetical protein KGL35_18760, partial [Bradyrhizobium sp.]|nr:hypothetical protein [Bradyrhizobium sp.]
MAATLGDLPGVAVTGTAVGARPEQRGPELSIVSDDGDTVVNIGPKNPDEDEPKGPFEGEFAANLAETLSADKLSSCANQLWTDIQADEQSRKGWLDTRTRGLGLLGLELIEPRGDVGASSAPLEGMSTVTSPLLLSEVLRAQATARGELLPADGPVKVLDESTYGTAGRDELADALEKDLNTYLTRVAKEYYPDSDRILFYTCFGGVGYKKGFHCPVRRRPVIESVDAADLIVNAGATDLASARRVTHVIKMRASMVKRMVIAKAYRDVPLGQPTQQVSEAKKKEAEIQGVDVTGAQPQDIDHT